MAQCFTSNEQGMMKKLKSKTLPKKERVLSSPPAALQPPQVVNLKNTEVFVPTQRSASLNQILSSPKAPQSPGLRNVNRREKEDIICTARALYGYPNAADLKLEEDAEIKLLRFNRGDDIQVFEKDDSGWWAGACNSHKGIFPGSYVKVIDDPDILRAGEFRKRSRASPMSLNPELKSTSSPQIVTPVPQFSPLVIDHKTDPAISTELLYEKYLSEQLYKYDSELLKLKAQMEGKDKLMELLTRENLSLKLEMSELKKTLNERVGASNEKSVFFQKQLLETEMQLTCSKVELEDLNKLIQDAKETLKQTQQEIHDHKTNGVPTAHLNVAAIKKSLQLQHQLNMMKTHLDEETAGRKDAEQQVADSLKHMETVIQASKSKGFDLKIAHKINIVLAGMLGTPDLSNDQMMEMLRKLKDAVSAYIMHSDMTLCLPPSSSSSSSSGMSGRNRSVSTPEHPNNLARPSVIATENNTTAGTIHPPTPVTPRAGSRPFVDTLAC